jgi:dihydrofolate reductase
MSKLRCHISISLDGFVAGPNQSPENPLGEGGQRLHEWVFPLAAFRESHGGQGGEVNESTPVVEESRANVGASVMGRNMFGPVRGDWGDEQWTGWWGDNPPYHYPVYVLTHHRRDPLEMDGGTTFHFVTDGIESALEQARKAAGEKDVMPWGGAQVVRQYLAAGLLDELELHVVPVLLGSGARLLDDLGDADVRLEQVRAVEAPGVTHLKYRVVRLIQDGVPAKRPLGEERDDCLLDVRREVRRRAVRFEGVLVGVPLVEDEPLGRVGGLVHGELKAARFRLAVGDVPA